MYGAATSGALAVAQAQNQPTARDQTVIEAASTRIQDASGKIQQLAMMLNDMADRAFGPPAPAGAEAHPRAVPSGTVGALSEQLEGLHAAIEFLSTRINRVAPLA